MFGAAFTPYLSFVGRREKLENMKIFDFSFATPHQYILCILVLSVAQRKCRDGCLAVLSQAIDEMRIFTAVLTIGAVTPPEK